MNYGIGCRKGLVMWGIKKIGVEISIIRIDFLFLSYKIKTWTQKSLCRSIKRLLKRQKSMQIAIISAYPD